MSLTPAGGSPQPLSLPSKGPRQRGTETSRACCALFLPLTHRTRAHENGCSSKVRRSRLIRHAAKATGREMKPGDVAQAPGAEALQESATTREAGHQTRPRWAGGQGRPGSEQSFMTLQVSTRGCGRKAVRRGTAQARGVAGEEGGPPVPRLCPTGVRELPRGSPGGCLQLQTAKDPSVRHRSTGRRARSVSMPARRIWVHRAMWVHLTGHAPPAPSLPAHGLCLPIAACEALSVP